MADCLFCKIVAGEIPVKRVAEDEHALAFPDINPQAPVHLLVIPKKHIASLNDVQPGDWDLIGRVHALAVKAAEAAGVAKTGFRTAINTGKDAHQLVFHVHLHVLGGRPMGWPPG
jgi:histidine triad (HIT) family protein